MTQAREPRYPVDAPSDAACARAWETIMRMATAHALILQAYGGVATLAMPEDQRAADIRTTVLAAHGVNETPEEV